MSENKSDIALYAFLVLLTALLCAAVMLLGADIGRAT